MYYKSPLTYILVGLFLTLLATNSLINNEQQFVALAKSFLSGNTQINYTRSISDLALFEGKYYWPLGPFPALIIIPFVMLTDNFLQLFIAFPLSILNFYLLYKIAIRLIGSHKRSLLLSTFFIFGSIYTPLGAISASWYYAQVVACTLTIVALWIFFYYKKSYFSMGLFVAFAMATRFNIILASFFFLYFACKEENKIRNSIIFLIPILITVLMTFAYNHVRFRDPFESGYKYQLIPEQALTRRNEGMFAIVHIPSNLYYMLLKGPEPIFKDDSHLLKFPYLTFDNYGLSVFFLSPILLLIFFANYKKELNKISLITSLLIMIPVITYYGIGQKQVGYRYALDFLPFLFLIIADTQSKLSLNFLRIIIFFGVFFAIYFSFLYLGGYDVSR